MNLNKNLDICQVKEILEVIYKAKYITTKETLDDEGWILLANELKKDYPLIQLIKLNEIILKGIKGGYEYNKYQQFNFKTIYDWIKEEMNENEYRAPKNW